MNQVVGWGLVIIFSAAFFAWIYHDGKLHHLVDRNVRDYKAPEILTLLYVLLILFSWVISLIHLFFPS